MGHTLKWGKTGIFSPDTLKWVNPLKCARTVGTSTQIWKMGGRMANFVFRQISGSPIDLSTKSLANTFSLRSYERSKLSLQEAFLHMILTQKSVTLRMYELNLVETHIGSLFELYRS